MAECLRWRLAERIDAPHPPEGDLHVVVAVVDHVEPRPGADAQGHLAGAGGRLVGDGWSVGGLMGGLVGGSVGVGGWIGSFCFRSSAGDRATDHAAKQLTGGRITSGQSNSSRGNRPAPATVSDMWGDEVSPLTKTGRVASYDLVLQWVLHGRVYVENKSLHLVAVVAVLSCRSQTPDQVTTASNRPGGLRSEPQRDPDPLVRREDERPMNGGVEGVHPQAAGLLFGAGGAKEDLWIRECARWSGCGCRQPGGSAPIVS
jgi:hypothetical protein